MRAAAVVAAAFQELARAVIPKFFEPRGETTAGIRVWVPGCATGEEVYSIAMLLLEEGGEASYAPLSYLYRGPHRIEREETRC